MRPLVISHAACGGHAPANTLQGIRKAIELGSEAIEIDVQATADGVPILMHDLTVDRTTNGAGEVAKMTLNQIRALDAGGEPPPTLAEVLDLTKGVVLLVMEIKALGIEQEVAKVVEEAAARDHVMTWSFFPEALDGMRVADPGVPCALLVAGEYMDRWPALRSRAVKTGAQGVSVFFAGIDDRVVEDCRRSGLALYSWTADQPEHIARLIEQGVDGICSNFPDRVVAALG
ncbi:MAG TPA: glycerophosphodiester phosphodiesterase family protein [Dehalococcoidia bacterium]|nr:glycerophosphodiester phosphodiesterase family protein [Dehalococcoidia bacterium]